MAENNIPAKIIEAAKPLIDMYGVHFSYLGLYDGADAYVYEFPEDSETGFPFVYLLKDNSVTEVTEHIALHIIDSTLIDEDDNDDDI